jgi:hypothetical protein
MPPETQNNHPESLRIFSVGHSNHAVERLLVLWKAYGIRAVVDARSQPYLNYATQSDHEALKLALEDAGIR